MKKTFFVTTPIYYVNDKPHVGHAYATFAADTVARYYRQKLGKENVWFSTGTDENSQKTVEAAEKAGKEVGAYTDELAEVWKSTFEKLGIEFNKQSDFIRTTEPRHQIAVNHFVDLIEKGKTPNGNNNIYKGVYEGWYCIGHEAFLKEADLVDGKCPEHNRKPEWLKEENYFFRLSDYAERLLNYYDEHPNFVYPITRFNEVKQFVKGGLEDISISRRGLKWGIIHPFFQTDREIIYVWFDALINYLTTIGYPDEKYTKFWPGVHIVGKDIIKFHCIIWPAMLMSAGIEPPKQVVAHGFFTVNGKKISKSLGNAIDPLVLAEKYGSDALRYFLFREIPFGGDGDFSEEKLKQRYTSDLANGLGNLVSRVTNMIEKYAEGKFTRKDDAVSGIVREPIARDFESFQFHKALETIWTQIDSSNMLIDEQEPWKMAKEGNTDLPNLLNELASRVLDIAEFLAPFMPETSSMIAKAFQQPVKKAAPLFPRLT